jgi:alpha-D-xyloside xylohydrolase
MLWRFDSTTQSIWRTYDDLRYRLMPYTYSVAWQVTHHRASIVFPRVVDYA